MSIPLSVLLGSPMYLCSVDPCRGSLFTNVMLPVLFARTAPLNSSIANPVADLHHKTPIL